MGFVCWTGDVNEAIAVREPNTMLPERLLLAEVGFIKNYFDKKE